VIEPPGPRCPVCGARMLLGREKPGPLATIRKNSRVLFSCGKCRVHAETYSSVKSPPIPATVRTATRAVFKRDSSQSVGIIANS
jgi:hypothetical protein